jgi:hypothetical protein
MFDANASEEVVYDFEGTVRSFDDANQRRGSCTELVR